MSNLEILTMHAVQSIDEKMRDQRAIDWEQRRYEIAKELYANKCLDVVAEYVAMSMYVTDVEQLEARLAVQWADALIAELKRTDEESLQS